MDTGIYVYQVDMVTGRLSLLSTLQGVDNPSYLAAHPTRPHVYAVNEVKEFSGKPGGSVTAFSVDGETDLLALMNQKPTIGVGPCYVSLDQTNRYALVANYGGGSVTAIPLKEDGSLGDPTDHIQHEGGSVHPTRQTGPYAHCIMPAPTNDRILVCDLGVDRIYVYQLNPETGRLESGRVPWIEVPEGSGPRHLAIHKNGRFIYTINELNSTVSAYEVDDDSCSYNLRPIQTLPTIPKAYSETNYCADVHVHPSGRFLYGSNRGHDSIVIYSIDTESGRLSLVGHESTRGSSPRSFAIDPSGSLMVVANQNSNNIVSFFIHGDTGELSFTRHEVEVSMPVCVKFR